MFIAKLIFVSLATSTSEYLGVLIVSKNTKLLETTILSIQHDFTLINNKHIKIFHIHFLLVPLHKLNVPIDLETHDSVKSNGLRQARHHNHRHSEII